MIQKILNLKKVFHTLILLMTILLAFFINLYVKMFLGGFLLITCILAGMVLNLKEFLLILTLSTFNFFFFAFYYQLPLKTFVMQGTVFIVSLIACAFVSIEIKKYIDDLKNSKTENILLTKELVMSFINAIDAKDQYLHNHSQNVCQYAIKIAQALQLDQQQINSIGLSALLHDIGKISTPEFILNKPDKLTEAEWCIMKQHATEGPDILKNVTKLKHITQIIKYHHRHFDGSGYPADLANEHIPLGSRIISVADAFDAMTSNRPYRKALKSEDALNEIIKFSGTQFDPQVVNAFLKTNIHSTSKADMPFNLPDFFIS